MDILLLILGVPVAYIVIAIGLYRFLFEERKTLFALEEPLDVLASMFWPVGLPVAVICIGTIKLCQSIYNFKLPSPSSKKTTELFPGVERPSFILAQMVAARIVQNFVGIGYKSWQDSKIKIKWDHPYGKSGQMTHLEDVVISVTGKPNLSISNADKESLKVISDALIKASQLKVEKDTADAISKQENAALSVIESITIGEPEKKGS